MTLLDRLRQDLPADWQPAPQDPRLDGWYADAARTVYLTIGERRLFVGARSHGGIVGEPGWGLRSARWSALHRSIRESVARLALDHAREGKPIPPVPTWAAQALRLAQANRLRTLAEREAKARQDLAAIDAERTLLTTKETA